MAKTHYRRTFNRDAAPLTWSVHDFIIREMKSGKPFPRRLVIATAINQPPKAIDDALLRLCGWGKISRTKPQGSASPYVYELADSFACANLKAGLIRKD